MGSSIRLEREAPAARQAGGTVVIGVLLTVLGGGLVVVARSVEMRGGDREWLAYVVGGGFVVVGILLLFFATRMILAARLPETIVEVDRMPVRTGQPFRVAVRQPGPMRLGSLRLNVVGEQITRREVWRRGRRRIETDRHLIHQTNVIDLKPSTIARGEEVAGHGEATIPPEVALVDIDGEKSVVWRLEVWGRVRGWVDFGHPFVLTVAGGRPRRGRQDSRET